MHQSRVSACSSPRKTLKADSAAARSSNSLNETRCNGMPSIFSSTLKETTLLTRKTAWTLTKWSALTHNVGVPLASRTGSRRMAATILPRRPTYDNEHRSETIARQQWISISVTATRRAVTVIENLGTP